MLRILGNDVFNPGRSVWLSVLDRFYSHQKHRKLDVMGKIKALKEIVTSSLTQVKDETQQTHIKTAFERGFTKFEAVIGPAKRCHLSYKSYWQHQWSASNSNLQDWQSQTVADLEHVKQYAQGINT